MTTRGELPTALARPVAQELLTSRIPARLAYSGKAGDPRVLPIWFRCRARPSSSPPGRTRPRSAIRPRPEVALTIEATRRPIDACKPAARPRSTSSTASRPNTRKPLHHCYGRRLPAISGSNGCAPSRPGWRGSRSADLGPAIGRRQPDAGLGRGAARRGLDPTTLGHGAHVPQGDPERTRHLARIHPEPRAEAKNTPIRGIMFRLNNPDSARRGVRSAGPWFP